MERLGNSDRLTIITTDLESFANSFAQDVDEGLSSTAKHLPCIYFYDYRGSLLFEKICGLPEYYLTRAETEILSTYSDEIISHLPPECLLVELGSGSSAKTRYVIEELLKRPGTVIYSPIDISRKMLRESAVSLLETYDDLEIMPVAAEYGEGLRQVDMRSHQPKLILWLGSSIGNFDPVEAALFLQEIVKSLSGDDSLLIGFDLQKDRHILERAYDDSQGVTAEFNLNILRRINRELGGQFDLTRFAHKAIYNEERHRVEMYLASLCDHEVRIAALDRRYHFADHERIHTENSHKFSPADIEVLGDRVGIRIVASWTDPLGYFNLTLFGLGGS
jgi:dimethylhistidine N-methyltransferase